MKKKVLQNRKDFFENLITNYLEFYHMGLFLWNKLNRQELS